MQTRARPGAEVLGLVHRHLDVVASADVHRDGGPAADRQLY